jgi:hypothetical protein
MAGPHGGPRLIQYNGPAVGEIDGNGRFVGTDKGAYPYDGHRMLDFDRFINFRRCHDKAFRYRRRHPRGVAFRYDRLGAPAQKYT